MAIKEKIIPNYIDVNDYSSFPAAIDAIGATATTLLIPNQQNITVDKTVPKNVTLYFLQGGRLDIDNGVTVAINGCLEAGMYQIFQGLGVVTFGYPTKIFTEWWGVDGVDDHLQMIQALASLPSDGGIIHLVSDRYSWFNTDTTTPVLKEFVTIEGEGNSTTIYVKTDITPFIIDNLEEMCLKNFSIRLYCTATTKPVIELFVDVDGGKVRYNHFENLFLYDMSSVANRGATGIRLHAEAPSGDSSNITENVFRNIQLFFMETGIKLETDVSNNPYINGNRFDDIWLFQPKVGIEFSKNSSAALATNRNLFTNVKVQCGGWTTDGFKNITNRGNIFDNCLIWDFGNCTSPNYSWSIDAQAEDTSIHTTSIEIAYFSDLGENTQIRCPEYFACKKIILDQLTADDAITEFRSSDVIHGITDRIGTNTYGHIRKAVGTSGGVQLEGETEGNRAVALMGVVTSDNTDKGTSARAAIELIAGKKSGTGWGAMGANGNLLAVREYASTRFLVDEGGDVYAIGGIFHGVGAQLSGMTTAGFVKNDAGGNLTGGNAGGSLASYYIESDTDSNTSSTSWQTKLTYTVVEAGDYLVQWNFELRGSSTGYHCRSQVLHNSTQYANVQFEPEDVSPAFWLSGAGFKKLTLAVDDTIKIEYCSENNSTTTTIRFARISLLKV